VSTTDEAFSLFKEGLERPRKKTKFLFFLLQRGDKEIDFHRLLERTQDWLSIDRKGIESFFLTFTQILDRGESVENDFLQWLDDYSSKKEETLAKDSHFLERMRKILSSKS
jgi:hypothetical protein